MTKEGKERVLERLRLRAELERKQAEQNDARDGDLHVSVAHRAAAEAYDVAASIVEEHIA